MSLMPQKFDDLEVPDNIFHCKKCDKIVNKYDKYFNGCGRSLGKATEKDLEDFTVLF